MTTGASDGQVYLQSYLAPFADVLARADVTDIYVNRPREVWVETLGGRTERHELAGLSAVVLTRLARQVAAHSHQGINREHPILSATLPGGERVQIVMPPATRGDMAVAIRKHVSADLGLGDYVAAGSFDAVLANGTVTGRDEAPSLQTLLQRGDVGEMLANAVRSRKNILVCGGTSTGKTTFLNALLREIPDHERLVLIEDTPELRLRHQNVVSFLAARSALGEAAVNADDLLNASLRMRPDRIILGELRGPEAYTFLRAVNTGHPGSMTTVHADSPQRAVEQIALLVLQGGTRLNREDVTHYVRSTIDVFVQLDRMSGRRQVSAVILRDDL